jgi:hypothetical protein
MPSSDSWIVLLSIKQYFFFHVDAVEEFEDDLGAFETLMLENDQWQMILSVAKDAAYRSKTFRRVYIIKVSGRGMMFLLRWAQDTYGHMTFLAGSK